MSEQKRIEQTLRSMPPKILEAYLLDLGGKRASEGRVIGPGWQAHLERLEDFQLGSIRVGQVHLTLEGEAEVLDALMPRLEMKLLRAGA